MNTATLLIEFLTEELPPINLYKNIGEPFGLGMKEELKNFINIPTEIRLIVTPRRFGCLIKNICTTEPDTEILRKGPAINESILDNMPTKALEGFMRSCSITDISELEQKEGYFYARQKINGKTLDKVLSVAISNSLKKLHIAKNMRWGNNDFSFVRPVHNLLIMHGSQSIKLNTPILGLTSVNYTIGHRIMSQGNIIIEHAEKYIEQLKQQGKVIADYNERKNYIAEQLNIQANNHELQLNHIQGLLDEVTAITEYPIVLAGQFDISFLEIPQECLILSMAKHQKYFALLDKQGKLTNKFLFVANITSQDPNVIINGNEKVLRARLADAKFFFDVDKSHPLQFFVDKLFSMVYHTKLGTQQERITRLKKIVNKFTQFFSINAIQAQRAAHLAKADLTTEMVGEFPELQGIMGKYYALHNGEGTEIAQAIEEHYYPRFSGDNLPSTNLAVALSLADKLETLIGIWGIGLIPTGDKDPFALRRMALGVARILLQHEANLKDLLDITLKTFENIKLNPNTNDKVYEFILQRLFHYLIEVKGYSIDCVQSIFVQKPNSFVHIESLLQTLQNFASNPNNKLIIEANKRIENILKKNLIAANYEDILPNKELFETPQEHVLYENFSKIIGANSIHFKNNLDYFSYLETLNKPIAAFFNDVMVMDDNADIRNNRLILLNNLHKVMNSHCKLSELNI